MSFDEDNLILTSYAGNVAIIFTVPKVGGEITEVFTQSDMNIHDLVHYTGLNGVGITFAIEQSLEGTFLSQIDANGNLTRENDFDFSGLNGLPQLNCITDENGHPIFLIADKSNGGIQFEYINNVAVKNSQNIQTSIYPNPTNGKINIETQEQIEKITILDISGKIIIETTNTEIDLSKQKTGTYFVKIETASGILTEKIVVE